MPASTAGALVRVEALPLQCSVSALLLLLLFYNADKLKHIRSNSPNTLLTHFTTSGGSRICQRGGGPWRAREPKRGSGGGAPSGA